MVTHNEIVKKLGFDPLYDEYDYELSGTEDDTKPSPFSVLNYEEKKFIVREILEATKHEKSPS